MCYPVNWKGLNERGQRQHFAGQLAGQIVNEYMRARDLHQPFHSYHEGLGVLWEEFDELKREVFLREHNVEAIRLEAIQVAAMALAMCVDFPLPSTSEQGIR